MRVQSKGQEEHAVITLSTDGEYTDIEWKVWKYADIIHKSPSGNDLGSSHPTRRFPATTPLAPQGSITLKVGRVEREPSLSPVSPAIYSRLARGEPVTGAEK